VLAPKAKTTHQKEVYTISEFTKQLNKRDVMVLNFTGNRIKYTKITRVGEDWFKSLLLARISKYFLGSIISFYPLWTHYSSNL